MHAHVGDEIIIDGHRVGEPRRRGRIVEVRRDDGEPPYRVRWDESDSTTLIFPGTDSAIHHVGAHVESTPCGCPEDVAS